MFSGECSFEYTMQISRQSVKIFWSYGSAHFEKRGFEKNAFKVVRCKNHR